MRPVRAIGLKRSEDFLDRIEGEQPVDGSQMRLDGGLARIGLQTVGDIEILNPNHVICTLDEGAEIRMEFTVNNGKGYVPAEQNRPDDAPIGLIAIDSIYSPVRRVAYRVENTREGQVLYELARPLVDGLDALETEFKSRLKGLEGGELNIAAGASTIIYLLPELIAEFRRAHPEVQLRLHNVTGKDGLALIRSDEVDLAVG